MLTVLFTFYIQGVLKLKKNNSGAKGLKPTRLTGDLHGDLSTLMIIFRLIFLIVRNISYKSRDAQNPLFLLSNFFFSNKSRAVYNVEKYVEPDRQRMTV